jgi:hypothetical protein
LRLSHLSHLLGLLGLSHLLGLLGLLRLLHLLHRLNLQSQLDLECLEFPECLARLAEAQSRKSLWK